MRTHISFRTRIFLCVLLTTIATIALPLYYAQVTLHDDLLRQATQQALHEVRLVARLLEDMPRHASMREYVRNVGDPTWRLSLITQDGSVLADSAISKEHTARLENHADPYGRNERNSA